MSEKLSCASSFEFMINKMDLPRCVKDILYLDNAYNLQMDEYIIFINCSGCNKSRSNNGRHNLCSIGYNADSLETYYRVNTIWNNKKQEVRMRMIIDKLDKLTAIVSRQETQLNELKETLYYQPGGKVYEEAKDHFESINDN